MPVLGNEDHKQRVNLSSLARSVIEIDQNVFDEGGSLSGFLNRIITAFRDTAEASVDLAVEERRPGDLWLICSDGLHGMVSDSKMEAILGINTPEAAAKLLMDAALAAGGRDNISVVLVKEGEVS